MTPAHKMAGSRRKCSYEEKVCVVCVCICVLCVCVCVVCVCSVCVLCVCCVYSYAGHHFNVLDVAFLLPLLHTMFPVSSFQVSARYMY